MNTETNPEATAKKPPKSKRLSSLIWILVLWGGVRSCAEMDGVSWERAFPSGIVIFGLWPATLFLGLSAIVPILLYQAILRSAALIAVLGSFFTLFFFKNQKQGIAFIVWEQRALVFITLAAISIHWLMRKIKNV
jgi:hypothetical protein